MSQTIDGTVVSMRWARPSTRGRSPLFGGVVHWDERWTPGANVATTFRTSKPITLNGIAVPAGAWSVWVDVTEDGPWSLILDPDTVLYHTMPPEDAEDQLRVAVEPVDGPEMDALLWYFATVRPSGGELRMHWGRTVLAFDVEVEPTQRLTTTPDQAAPVTGEWVGVWVSPAGESPEWTMEVARDPDSGLLVGAMPAPDGTVMEMYLLPRVEGIFLLGWGENGEVWENTGVMFEFTPVDGTARSFEARDPQDRVMARGRRADGGPPR